MRYSKQRFQSFVVFRTEGEFSAGTIGNELMSAMLQEVRLGNAKIIIDMENITYINSSGIRLLLQMQHGVQSNGGLLLLVNVPTVVGKVFSDLRLNDFFTRFASLEDAARSMG